MQRRHQRIRRPALDAAEQHLHLVRIVRGGERVLAADVPLLVELEQALVEGDAAEMMEAMMKYMPLRAMVNFSMGAFTEEMLTKLMDQLNEFSGSKDINLVNNK